MFSADGLALKCTPKIELLLTLVAWYAEYRLFGQDLWCALGNHLVCRGKSFGVHRQIFWCVGVHQQIRFAFALILEIKSHS